MILGILDTLINNPLGSVLRFFYELSGSYGFAIILFTIAVKILLFPIGIKQQKSTIKKIRLSPKEALIRKRYSYDQRLMQQKVSEFYQKEGFNPMGGCLPLLLQLPIIFALYRVIQRPLTYILKLGADVVMKIAQRLDVASYTEKALSDIPVAKAMVGNMDKLSDLVDASVKPIDFTLFGGLIDLSDTPSLGVFSALLLIPLLSGITAYIQGRITQANQKYTAEGQQAAKTMGVMNLMSPIISLVITFTLPAGVGLYWIISNIMGIAQTLLLNVIYSPKKAAREANEALRLEVERRRQKKNSLTQQKLAEKERVALEKKNAARRNAGLPPLKSLSSTEETSREDTQIEPEEQSDD